jgi:hypothetical protein
MELTVYMDSANIDAQVGLTNPATISADVLPLRLHKTLTIPSWRWRTWSRTNLYCEKISSVLQVIHWFK